MRQSPADVLGSADEVPEPTPPVDLLYQAAPVEASDVGGGASDRADEAPEPHSADEAPKPPTDAPEPTDGAPHLPADALGSGDEAPEPTAPTDVAEAQAEGAQNPVAHAENEARPVEGLKAKTSRDEAGASDLVGPGAEAGNTVLSGDRNRIPQAIEPTAELEVGAAEGGADQYGNSALRDGPNYQEEIDDQLGARSLDRSEHDKLRLTPTNDLTEAQAREVVGVRDGIKLGEGRMVTKVLKPEVAQAYLENATKLGNYDFKPGEFRGSIARGSDTADLRSMDQLRDGLALDDGGAGWTPVPPGASEAYQLRFPAPHGMRAEVTLGAVGDQELADHVAGMAGQSPGRAWDDPFLGTGYTGGGVPEWDAKPTGFPHHAEIWRMNADGTEEAVGFFDKNERLWNYYD
ncbi:hypothetical protein [Streptomyces alanosinicus]|uniref:hypothetical protein n=1 Tax=Streptomyces alanosinicus TaxID=68171 RepID=UPI001672865B|nr:hypothetical protein [Streptomyces alanosinicus]